LIGDDIFEHSEIELNVESTGTHRSDLTEHDVLRYTLAVILVSLSCSLHEDLDSLLERRFGECTSVCSVDTVSRDGHELSTLSHQVAKQCQVTVVDVGTIELDDVSQLLEQSGSTGLDPENLEYLVRIVRVSPDGVDAIHCQYLLEVATVCVDGPLSLRVVKVALCGDDRPILLLHENTADALDTTQCDIVKHHALKLDQRRVLVLCQPLVLLHIRREHRS
jgi:hypothetical protein